jgi:hypothetical protein
MLYDFFASKFSVSFIKNYRIRIFTNFHPIIILRKYFNFTGPTRDLTKTYHEFYGDIAATSPEPYRKPTGASTRTSTRILNESLYCSSVATLRKPFANFITGEFCKLRPGGPKIVILRFSRVEG